MDIAFYGGECYIGLEIETRGRRKPLITYHRITDEREHWNTSRASLEQDKLIIPGPGNKAFELSVNWESRTLDGVYHAQDMDIPTHLEYSAEITEAAANPAFFRNKAYVYRIPEPTGDGLDCGSLSASGLDDGTLRDLMGAILSEHYRNIRSLLVIKDGQLVVEEYFWQRSLGGFPYRLGGDMGQNIYSATRSFTAALLGIARDQNLIAGVHENIARFFPEQRELFDTEAKKGLTVEHFLTMESGLRWGDAEIETYQPLFDPMRSRAGGSIISFLLGQPLIDAPGETYRYNNELSTVLGEIIRRQSGQLLSQFAEEHLFDPLGIKRGNWFTYPDGVAAAGNGLKMTPRDMGKFGLMILDGGRWNGNQILSEEWIDASFRRRTAVGDNPYGYHWWLETFVVDGIRIPSASARGHYGQFIFIVPSLNMVTVFTSASEEGHTWDQPVDMMARYLVPAALSGRKPWSLSTARRTDRDRLSKYEGPYRFQENRFGIIGVRGDDVYYKPPDRPFEKMAPPLGLDLHSRDSDLFVSLGTAEDTGQLIITAISGNVEEQGLRLNTTRGGKRRDRIFFFPETPFRVLFWIYAGFLLAGACGLLSRRLRKATKQDLSPVRDRIGWPIAAWTGVSLLVSLALVQLLLTNGTALEEIINLGTYSFGWDERIIVLLFIIMALGTGSWTLGLWLKRSGTAFERLYYTTLSVVSAGLAGLMWDTGLLYLLLLG